MSESPKGKGGVGDAKLNKPGLAFAGLWAFYPVLPQVQG